MRGKVKWYDKTKGFGFIQTEDGSDVYVHHSAINDKNRKKLEEGQMVVFEVADGERGLEATLVKVERLG